MAQFIITSVNEKNDTNFPWFAVLTSLDGANMELGPIAYSNGLTICYPLKSECPAKDNIGKVTPLDLEKFRITASQSTYTSKKTGEIITKTNWWLSNPSEKYPAGVYDENGETTELK
jgi:hypothetical protein